MDSDESYEQPQPSTSEDLNIRSKRKRRPNTQIYRNDMITEKTVQTSQKSDDDFDFTLDVSDDEHSDSENDSEVGSILRKGIKFSSPEEREKFMQPVTNTSVQAQEEESGEEEDFGFDIDNNDETIIFNEPDDDYEPNQADFATVAPDPQVPQNITTGFENIEWKHLPFGDNATTFGEALLKAGHIRKVREIRKPGSLPEIVGFCLPQTNIREKDYKIDISIDINRKITKTRCDCRDGVLCKHIRGLIIYINTYRDIAQTNISCGFNQPSTSKQNLYPKGEELEKIDNIPAKYRMRKLKFDMPSVEKRKNYANLMRKHGLTDSPLFTICNETLPDVLTPELDLPEWVKIYVLKETDSNKIPHIAYRISGPKDPEKYFYDNEVFLTHEQRFRVCVLTQEQGKCKAWREERFIRFTGIFHI